MSNAASMKERKKIRLHFAKFAPPLKLIARSLLKHFNRFFALENIRHQQAAASQYSPYIFKLLQKPKASVNIFTRLWME